MTLTTSTNDEGTIPMTDQQPAPTPADAITSRPPFPAVMPRFEPLLPRYAPAACRCGLPDDVASNDPRGAMLGIVDRTLGQHAVFVDLSVKDMERISSQLCAPESSPSHRMRTGFAWHAIEARTPRAVAALALVGR